MGIPPKIRVALMSYAMDNRKAKGTALYTRKLIENLLGDDRFEFYLVHYEKVDDPIYKRAKEILMPRVRLPYASHFFSQLLFFWKYRNNKFDIIHWFQPRVYPFFWLAPAKKIVITTHGAGDITAPGRWIFSREVFNFILKHFNHKVDSLIAVSEYGVKEIEEYYHAKPERIFFTYNGGGEDFKPLSKDVARRYIGEKYKLTNSFILAVGRHIPHKNLVRLIGAYRLLRSKHERTEKLVIVGSSGSETQLIRAAVSNSGYEEDVIFIDYVDERDLNMIYSAAELLIFPSLQEGFGLPIVEAMASGTPVVTSNITSMPEIAGEATVLVDPYNLKDMADGMNKVLADKKFAHDLVAKGLVRSKLFTWRITAERTKKIYLDLSDSII
ncbi:MAG: glycosyltransferase family 4 protein [Candidatus Vogelbacteria bacterium]|nr:glycosyltransferase family 4 protein [Candidatus Vogelbacteria bacterium]